MASRLINPSPTLIKERIFLFQSYKATYSEIVKRLKGRCVPRGSAFLPGLVLTRGSNRTVLVAAGAAVLVDDGCAPHWIAYGATLGAVSSPGEMALAKAW
jgi:hypothetical protein